MSTSLITEVKRQWATLVLGWVTVQGLHEVWDIFNSTFIFVAVHKFQRATLMTKTFFDLVSTGCLEIFLCKEKSALERALCQLTECF